MTTEFRVVGDELIRKKVVSSGKGAHVYLPKEWLGEEIVIIRGSSGGSEK